MTLAGGAMTLAAMAKRPTQVGPSWPRSTDTPDPGEPPMAEIPHLDAGPPGAAPPQAPLRAVHTPNFPAILRRLNASLLVTTYQAGKLVMVRDEGDHLNTHFRAFAAPMGLALRGDRLAIGTSMQIWEYRDSPRWPPSCPARSVTTPLPARGGATSSATCRSTRWPGARPWSCTANILIL